MMFRDLRADEIECRVQSVKEKGLILLLYKNARCDMNILDETVTSARWQREHYECKGNLFCRVGINFDGEWVWKADCGTESNTEAEKGEASDSFKRACFNWGIGRELYTAPFIWVGSDKCSINGSKCYDRFYVDSIEIADKRIVGLVIKNESKGHCVAFAMGSSGMKKMKTARERFLEEIAKQGLSPVEAAAKYELTKGTTEERYVELLREMGVAYGAA